MGGILLLAYLSLGPQNVAKIRSAVTVGTT